MKPIKIRTKNHTAAAIRGKILSNKRVIFRLGSRTPTQEVFPKSFGKREIIEINTVEACTNSADKILMKKCFDAHEVKSAKWANVSKDWDVFPAIIKHKFSSKGNGIHLIQSREELELFINSNNEIDRYIIEKFHNYTKEYRLHVDKNGCFYTCRKLLKNEADENNRWHRHDENSVWILEENPSFSKPKNWESIVEHCVKALNSVGLDIGACDVKVQTEKGKKDTFVPDFIVMEINSAPALGEVTAKKYIEKITQLVN